MAKKANGGTKANNIVKVTEAKAMAMKVATMLNGKPTSKPKPKMDLDGLVERANKGEAPASKLKSVSKKTKAEAKPKVDQRAERRGFIKQNAATILKAWDGLKGKKSAAAVGRALPSTWRNKWVDEVLMLAGLRKSGEEVVIKAVAEDQSFLKDVVVVRKANDKSKALIAREKKEAASVARFKTTQAPIVKNGGYTDEG